MYYIVIRVAKITDEPVISHVVKNAYLSNSFHTWFKAFFHMDTLQLIAVVVLMFIIFNVSLIYFIISTPIVFSLLYILIYRSWMKQSDHIIDKKRALQSWVAEVYEPFFPTRKPKDQRYKIIPEEKIQGEDLPVDQLSRKIIGTVAVMSHKNLDNVSWLFRLAVDESYRRKGVGLHLVQAVKNWTKDRQFNSIETAVSEWQEGAKIVLSKAGYGMLMTSKEDETVPSMLVEEYYDKSLLDRNTL